MDKNSLYRNVLFSICILFVFTSEIQSQSRCLPCTHMLIDCTYLKAHAEDDTITSDDTIKVKGDIISPDGFQYVPIDSAYWIAEIQLYDTTAVTYFSVTQPIDTAMIVDTLGVKRLPELVIPVPKLPADQRCVRTNNGEYEVRIGVQYWMGGCFYNQRRNFSIIVNDYDFELKFINEPYILDMIKRSSVTVSCSNNDPENIVPVKWRFDLLPYFSYKSDTLRRPHIAYRPEFVSSDTLFTGVMDLNGMYTTFVDSCINCQWKRFGFDEAAYAPRWDKFNPDTDMGNILALLHVNVQFSNGIGLSKVTYILISDKGLTRLQDRKQVSASGSGSNIIRISNGNATQINGCIEHPSDNFETIHILDIKGRIIGAGDLVNNRFSITTGRQNVSRQCVIVVLTSGGNRVVQRRLM